MAGGMGGVPQKQKTGGELSTLAARPRVGPKTLANPKPTRVGKGVQGAKPPWRGVWGMCPQKPKEGKLLTLKPNFSYTALRESHSPSATPIEYYLLAKV
jgi:hypothetical protein